jgi:hypothetical protein
MASVRAVMKSPLMEGSMYPDVSEHLKASGPVDDSNSHDFASVLVASFELWNSPNWSPTGCLKPTTRDGDSHRFPESLDIRLSFGFYISNLSIEPAFETETRGFSFSIWDQASDLVLISSYFRDEDSIPFRDSKSLIGRSVDRLDSSTSYDDTKAFHNSHGVIGDCDMQDSHSFDGSSGLVISLCQESESDCESAPVACSLHLDSSRLLAESSGFDISIMVANSLALRGSSYIESDQFVTSADVSDGSSTLPGSRSPSESGRLLSSSPCERTAQFEGSKFVKRSEPIPATDELEVCSAVLFEPTLVEDSDLIVVSARLRRSDWVDNSGCDSFDSVFVASLEFHDSERVSRTSRLNVTNSEGGSNVTVESMGMSNSFRFQISNTIEKSICDMKTLLSYLSSSFDDSTIVPVTFPMTISMEIGQTRCINASERLRGSAFSISNIYECSDWFNPSQLLRNREARVVAESSIVKGSTGILAGIVVGVALLCLLTIVVILIWKRHRRESYPSGHEMLYETELRDEIGDGDDSDMDSDSNFDEQEDDVDRESTTSEEEVVKEQPHDLFETDEWLARNCDVKADMVIDLNVEEGYVSVGPR